jgi:hypothetical protein
MELQYPVNRGTAGQHLDLDRKQGFIYYGRVVALAEAARGREESPALSVVSTDGNLNIRKR